jgi:hypothetical protein
METLAKWVGIPGGMISVMVLTGYLGDSRWVDDPTFAEAKAAHTDEHKSEKIETEKSVVDLREQMQQVQRSADKSQMMTAALVCKVLQNGTPIGENCVMRTRGSISLKKTIELVAPAPEVPGSSP